MCCLGYQHPLFPSQAAEATVPSVQAFIQRCYRTWRRAREALVQSEGRTKRAADRRRTVAPKYFLGKGFGSLPKICHCGFRPVSWHPNLSGHILLSRWSVRWRDGFGWLNLSVVSILSFMFLVLMLFYIPPILLMFLPLHPAPKFGFRFAISVVVHV